jgi:ABC-2 type transport system permease protein
LSAGVPGGLLAAESGSIYDIGYRKYDGPRLGRTAAFRALFWHSLRTSFGIGRGTRAKLAPVALAFLVSIPAIAIIGVQALIRQFPGGERLEGQLPIRYDTYAGAIGILVILFCAAQAPELFGRDQRYALHSLYFSRALRREDYAVARLAGFMVAVFLLQWLPQVLLFLGQVLLATDVISGATTDLPDLAKAAAQAAVTAGLLGGLSMAISAFTPRRAYAVAGIIALFLIPNIVAGIVVGVGSVDLGHWLLLLSPTSILDGTNAILFDAPVQGQLERAVVLIQPFEYAIAAAVGIAGSVLLCVRRLQRITA